MAGSFKGDPSIPKAARRGCGLIFAALLINRWYWIRHLVTRR
ncbi:hypothetical protein QC820_11275 [Halomonas mongoliensis]|uniref:Uncharacterized protein n=1 Tax=Halomonas mongoliensis TaxID=321265 RepID=A0ABU1GMY7_9GAMM|nr:hypothetical protein [Halomonas mongoliensis]MDR5893392.1 hypothetical protein [Halomonas mongoliensis]